MEPTALILFEFWVHGHAPNLLRIFLEHWNEHGPGVVRAVVRRRFLEEYPYVFEGFENVDGSRVRWVALEPEDESRVVAARARAELLEGVEDIRSGPLLHDELWSIIEQYAGRYPAKHILLMNVEDLFHPLAVGKRLPVGFSGVIFSPVFLYKRGPEFSFRVRALSAVQERLIAKVLSHEDGRTIFFLDRKVVEHFQGTHRVAVAYLSEPVQLPSRQPTEAESDEIRRRFGVPPGRTLFLMFGDLRSRKGLWKVFAALHHMTDEELASVCVAFVGKTNEESEERIRTEMSALAARPVVLLRDSAFVSDAVRDQWFGVADVVLVPYLFHSGNSNVLMLAAAHRKPVIAQDFAQIGRLVREHHLGVTADTRDPQDLARALRMFLDPKLPAEWDPDAAYAFAKAHPCARFASELLNPLRPFMT